MPRLRADGLRAALWSPHELRVESRDAVPRLAAWLERAHGVEFLRGVQVVGVDLPEVATSAGRFDAAMVVVCPGDDCLGLFAQRLAAYPLGRHRLVYSTSELCTQIRQGAQDLTLLHGRTGHDGETVLRFASQPRVRVMAGELKQSWDAAKGDLRLNYRHQGLIELEITGGGRAPLHLLIADEATAQAFWKLGEVLVLSPAMPRKAVKNGDALELSGDTHAASTLRVWAGHGVKRLRWNGAELATQIQGATLLARQPLSGPAALSLPDLSELR